MKLKILGLLAVGLLTGPVTAGAVAMHIDAFHAGTTNLAWFLDFEDTGDSLFQLAELTDFSGFEGHAFLHTMPTIAGISTFTTGFADGIVCFADSAQANTATCTVPSAFDYTKSVVATPEPGTLALLGLGLTGLASSRRRKAA